jgi:hypothetical protein
MKPSCVDLGDVAGVEPAIANALARGVRQVPVTADQVRPARDHLAGHAGRHRLARLVHYAYVDAVVGLPRRAHLVLRVFRRNQADAAVGLGEAVHLQHFDSHAKVGLDQVYRHRGRAAQHPAQVGARNLGALRMLVHDRQHRRHREKARDAFRLDHVPHQARVERLAQHAGHAAVNGRHGQAEPCNVEQRRDDDRAFAQAQVGRGKHAGQPREIGAVRHHRALGSARRAARVHHVQRVAVRGPDRWLSRRRATHRIRKLAGVRQQPAHPRKLLLQGMHERRLVGPVDDRRGTRVEQLIRELRHAEAPVQGDEHEARLRAGEVRLEKMRLVGHQAGHAFAGRDTRRQQRVRQLVGTRIQFAVGEARARRDVDYRLPVSTDLGALGQRLS